MCPEVESVHYNGSQRSPVAKIQRSGVCIRVPSYRSYTSYFPERSKKCCVGFSDGDTVTLYRIIFYNMRGWYSFHKDYVGVVVLSENQL